MGEEQSQEIKSIRLVVELSGDGNLKVECPMLQDQLFMLGLLEQIKLAVIQHNVAIRQNKIVKPSGGIMNFVRKRF